MSSISETAAAWAPRVRSLLRIVTGLLFLQHGTMKYFNFPPSDMFTDMPVVSMFGIGGLLELVGGALIVIGLFTRPVAFILSGMMAVAYFKFHFPGGFFPALNQGEPAIMFSFIFLYLACAGAGPWSVDAARGKA